MGIEDWGIENPDPDVADQHHSIPQPDDDH